VTELIAALVPIHNMLAFLADMYCLFGPPGKLHRLPVDHYRFGAVDHMVLLSRVVGEGGLSWLCLMNYYLHQSLIIANIIHASNIRLSDTKLHLYTHKLGAVINKLLTRMHS